MGWLREKKRGKRPSSRRKYRELRVFFVFVSCPRSGKMGVENQLSRKAGEVVFRVFVRLAESTSSFAEAKEKQWTGGAKPTLSYEKYHLLIIHAVK
jgi:hypothetical protein